MKEKTYIKILKKESLELITFEDLKNLDFYLGRAINSAVYADELVNNADRYKKVGIDPKDKSAKNIKECRKYITLAMNILRNLEIKELLEVVIKNEKIKNKEERVTNENKRWIKGNGIKYN